MFTTSITTSGETGREYALVTRRLAVAGALMFTSLVSAAHVSASGDANSHSTSPAAAGSTVTEQAFLAQESSVAPAVFSDVQQVEPGLDSLDATASALTVAQMLESITPARFVDTRVGFATIDSQFAGAGKRAAGATYEVQIAGRGDVPSNAVGAVINVTAVSPEASGFLTLYPCTPERPLASSLNFTVGVNIGNEVIASLDDEGKVCVYTHRNVDLTMDVVGFVPAGGGIEPLLPARLLDTRPGQATVDGKFAGSGRTVPMTSVSVDVTGRGNVPADADFVVVNVTAVDPQEPGFVTVYPCLNTVPGTSSLNHVAGVNRGNELVVEVSEAGQICLYTLRSINLTVDVVAYIPEPNTVVAVAPSRLSDSRPGFTTIDGEDQGYGKLAAGTERRVPITGRIGIPDAARSVIVNVTAVAAERSGFLTVHPCVSPRPVISSLNYVAGVNGGNELIAGLSPDGELCVYTHQAAHITVDLVGYLVDDSAPADDAPSITVTDPADGATGVGISDDITITFSEGVSVSGDWVTIVCGATTFNTTGSGGATVIGVSAADPVYTLDLAADLPEGETCTATVDDVLVSDDDAIDPPDTMAADFVFSFSTGPTVVADSYTSIGNVGIAPDAAGGLILGSGADTGSGLVVSEVQGSTGNVGATATTAQGGSVVVAADGSFDYTPPVGHEGADTFAYKVAKDGVASGVATVTITNGEPIWFVDNSTAALGNDGTLANPYTSLAAFVAANGTAGSANPAAGDDIYLAAGTGTYTGGLTLDDDQRLIGQGAPGTTLAAYLGIASPAFSKMLPPIAGTRPVVSNLGAVVLSASTADNTIAGLTIDDGTTGILASGTMDLAIDGVDVKNVASAGLMLNVLGTAEINDLEVDAIGSGDGVVLDATMTGSANFGGGLDVSVVNGVGFEALGGSVSVVNVGVEQIVASGTGQALVLDGVIVGAGGVRFDQVTTSASATGDGVDLVNVSGGAVVLASVSLAGGTATTGVDLLGVSSAVDVVAGAIGNGVRVNGGTGVVSFGADVGETAGHAVQVANRNSASLVEFGGAVSGGTGVVSVAGNTNVQVRFDGTVTATGSNNAGAVSISINGAATEVDFNGAVNATMTGNGKGIVITNDNAAVTFNGMTSLTVAEGVAVDVVGTVSGGINFIDLDIALTGNNATGFDVSNATLNVKVLATDFDLTSISSTGTTGVDLSGADGIGWLRLGDTTAPFGTGADATIAGVAVGVQFTAATDIDGGFIFGDGEDAIDIDSSISATTVFGGTLPPAWPVGYNFLDI